MPTYTFEDDKGDHFEIGYPLADVPPLGAKIKGPNGRTIRRVPDFDSVQIGARVGNVESSHRIVSQQVERWHSAAPRHDKSGRAVFNTKREVDEFLAKSNGEYVRDRDCGSETHARQHKAAIEERQRKSGERLCKERNTEAVTAAHQAYSSLTRMDKPTRGEKRALAKQYLGNLKKDRAAKEKALGDTIKGPDQ